MGLGSPSTKRRHPINRRRPRQIASSMQKAALLAFEREGGEAAGGEGAGVDADAAGADLGLHRDAVAMDDDDAMIGGRIEERLANPQQVVAQLALEADAGPYPGM